MNSKQGTNRRPPNAGKGRPAGIPNKLTSTVKMMILGALDAKGGQKWLEKQMDKYPQAFMTLLGKIIPTQVVGDMSYRYVARIPPPEEDADAWLKKYAPPANQTRPTSH
jgi:hypothetical protein